MRLHELPSRPRPARLAGLLMTAALLLGGLAPGQALAGTTISLFKSFPRIGDSPNLNFVTTGNTLRSRPNNTYPGGNSCTLLSGNNGTSVDAGTSSSALSGIPAGSTIVAAYLYYAGSGATVDSNVTFNGTAVTASRTFTDTTNATGNPFFSGFVDVTSLVTGNGTYSFGGLSVDDTNTYCANSTVLAGWGLFVIYSNPAEKNRVINVFDGFQPFQGDSITLTPNNFEIPTSNIDGKFAVLTWEGDPDINSTNGVTTNTETLQFNGNVLSDACNPVADTSLPNGSNGGAFVSGNPNQYNSTINTLKCTGTATTDEIYYGVDLDTFDVSSYLAAGSTSASSFYSSGQDLVFLSTQVISVTNVPISDLAITKSHTGNFTYGGNATWNIAVANNGPSATAGTITVTDTLAAGLTYVSGTGTGWTCGAAGQVVTCTSTSVVASGSSFPNITLVASVGLSTATPLANTATVAISGSGSTFDNNSANNSSTDNATVVYPSVDLAISKTNAQNFSTNTNGVFTLTVSNNGPAAVLAGSTTTVSDTLNANYSFVSGTGTGWTCGAVGQVVTCTTTAALANGASFPAISLTVAVASGAPATVSNTATISNPNVVDGVPANNSSTDVTTVTNPDLSTSYKDVVNLSGGYAVDGNTLQYTIVVQESGGQAANNATVTDDIPANLSGFTVVSIPTGATDNSTGTGTGANGDGFLNITGVNVPANGSVSIVFQVTLGGPDCTAITNTATLTGGNGGTGSPYLLTAPTITVNQSACGGNKILYVYDATGPTYTNLLNRVVQTANTGTGITVNGGASFTWNLSPAIATGKTLQLTAGNVTVSLIETNTNAATGTRRNTTVSLLKNGAPIATSGTVTTNNSNVAKVISYTFAIPATTILPTDTLGLQFNNKATANDHILISQKTATLTSSRISFATSTVINVDSITAYSGAYTGTGTPATVPVFSPGNTVYLCAVISDPFGSYDVDPSTLPQITLVDPLGGVEVNALNMTLNGGGGKDCSGNPNPAVNSYDYSFVIPATTPPAAYTKTGFWTVSVKAYEGQEPIATGVNTTSASTFDVDVPSLLIMKTVLISSDPTGAAIPHSVPGAVAQYTVLVQNNGRGPVDSGGLIISDPVPTNTVLSLPAKPPFTFTDGAQPSGLSIIGGTDTGNITYTDHSNNPYTPSCTRPCTDANIGGFKITLTGSMNGKTGATAPSFTITFNVVIQ